MPQWVGLITPKMKKPLQSSYEPPLPSPFRSWRAPFTENGSPGAHWGCQTDQREGDSLYFNLLPYF